MGELAGDRFAEITVTTAGQLRQWLERHHEQQEAIWLITYKKAAGDQYVPHDQVLDALIGYGWCDGIRRRIDELRSMQLVSPRRTQPWAKSYKDRAERLIDEGRMHPAAHAAIEHAKANGMWDAMNDVDALIVPDDLASALAGHPRATGHFTAFPAIDATQRLALGRVRPHPPHPRAAHRTDRRRRGAKYPHQDQRVTEPDQLTTVSRPAF